MEIEIDYSKLEIIPGVDSKLGFVVAIIDDGTNIEVGPQDGSFYNTTTWNTITTSDNWGISAVPEFGTFAMLGVIGIVAVLVILRKKK